MKRILNIFVNIKNCAMGMKIGEIEFTQILDNEFRIGVLESVIDLIMSKNSELLNVITKDDLDSINVRVTERLQKKYPNSGIQLNIKSDGNQ